MNTRKAIAAVVVTALAIAWLFWSMRPQTATELSLAAHGLGQVLAEQTANAMNDRGRTVLVVLAANDIQAQSTLDGFKEILRQHKNVTLADIKPISIAQTAMGRLSFYQVASIIKEFSNADAIAFTMGVTSLTESQLSTLPEPSPKLVVLDWAPGDVERGMKAGLIKAAISTRRLTALPTDNPKTPRQWFDRHYELTAPQ